MLACPRCHAAQVILSLDATRAARCLVCGTRWVQDGAERRNVVGPAVLDSKGQTAPAAVPEP